MEDQRGEEHIKLATEYGKTQLNTGQLVDAQGKPRGKGTELRTDERGTIRAGKGLFVSADKQAKARGEVLDMDAALKEIDQLNQQLQQLEMAAEQALALKADIDSQIQMFEQRLKPLNEALLISAPEGIAFTSGEHLQMTATKNVAINAGGDISAGVMGNMTALAGEKLGLFARTGQLSLKAGEGPIDMQAQNASLRLFAEKKLTLTSESDIAFAGKKRITLIGGGSYLKLEAGKVEYGTTASYMRKVKKTMAAGSCSLEENLTQMAAPLPEMLCVPVATCVHVTGSGAGSDEDIPLAPDADADAEVIRPDSPELSQKRYIYSPFVNNPDVLLYDSLAKFIDGKHHPEIVFVNKSQRDKFFHQLADEKMIIIEIIKLRNKHSDDDISEAVYGKFIDFHRSTEKYHFGEEPKPVIYVVGHGSPGDDMLSPTPVENILKRRYSFKIIESLIKTNLPADAIIKLDFCGGRVGQSPEDIPEDESMKTFYAGNMKDLTGSSDKNFSNLFTEALQKAIPYFCGEVQLPSCTRRISCLQRL
jgi:type VI secretion system secreted protein VgrG